MKRIAALIAVSLALAPAFAQERAPVPGDFAWQWPVQTDGTDGVVRFTVTPGVYERVTRADLSDLAAFNADGEAIPLASAALASERLAPPPPPAPRSVPLFRVPRVDAAGADRIDLHIARGADGRLQSLDATVAADTLPAASDWIVDLSGVDAPVTALTVDFGPIGASGLSARVAIEASDDLAAWSRVASELALVSLRENTLVLERRRLDFDPTQKPYLRLRRTDADAPLPLAAAHAYAVRSGPVASVPLAAIELEGTPDAGVAGAFRFALPGPLPLQRTQVRLADANAVATAILESRDGPEAPWIERSRDVAFRLGSGESAIESGAVDVPPLRVREWRVRTEPPQARAPKLAAWYRPDEFVMLTQGPAPYRLAAGSRGARRPDYPIRTVVAQLQAQRGDLWLPPEARLGAGAELAGDAALREPPAPPPYRRWLLWGVLVAGALGVLWMVASLVRGDASGRGPEGG